MASLKNRAEEILAHADIQVGGGRPWDIRVLNERFYERVLAGGALALGGSYMDGWWEVPALDQFIDRILRADLGKFIRPSLSLFLYYLKSKLFNLQSRSRAY